MRRSNPWSELVGRGWRARGYLTDTASHAPPTTGTYKYDNPNAWSPATAGFVAKGSTFTEPVFGDSVLRLTDNYPNGSNSDIYAKNGWWNADATYFLHRTSGSSWDVLNVPAATVKRSLSGLGSLEADALFDPVDPDVLYYFTGATVRKILISTGADSLVKTFAGTMQTMGGSVDWISADGRYWMVVYGGAAHVWDKQTDTLFTGSATIYFTAGWIGITPDGNYLVQAQTASPYYNSYAINKAGTSVNGTGVQFWTIGDDHGDLVSASDGKNYLVVSTSGGVGTPQIRARDITLAAGDETNQRNNSTLLPGYGNWAFAQHYSAVSKGALSDWCFLEQKGGDTYDTPGTWEAYKSELLLINVLTGAVRRYAHHRSRGNSYYQQPRVCVSWDGSRVAWASDFDANSANYADIYSIQTIASADASSSATDSVAPKISEAAAITAPTAKADAVAPGISEGYALTKSTGSDPYAPVTYTADLLRHGTITGERLR